ncbi:MAG: hypothetical protein HQ534_06450 [Armatimonadetes bacterium]|nr:hypothetical protein [Armatimonadota bacterium]
MERKLFIVFFILLFSFSVNAQLDLSLGPDWNFTGVGARAAGMGGAFIGVADDATAISWNPAGLTQLDKPEASIVGRGLGEIYEVDFDYGVETYEDEHAILNFLSGVYPFEFSGKQFIAALAVQRQLDLYSYYKEEYWGEDGSGFNRYYYEKFSEGGASTITLGLGSRMGSIFSLGAAINLWVGNALLESKYEFEDDLPDFYYYSESYDKSDWNFSGLNFVFGVMVDYNYLENPKPFKLGLVVKTPFDLKVDKEYSYESYIDNNGEITEYYDEESNSYPLGMPLICGFGASYCFGYNFTLAMDIEARLFGNSNLKEDYEDLTGNDEEIENQNLTQFRIGGEYLFTEIWDFAVIPFRLGIQTLPTLFKNMDGNQVVGGGISFGTGLITDRYSFDISAKNTKFDIEREDSDEFIYTKTINTITLSLIYYF